jgi:formylglycine-generating enzyme required for sulfatase activity
MAFRYFLLGIALFCRLSTAEPPIISPDSVVLVPEGSFDMGSTKGQKDERPVHPISVDSFYMGAHEVTVWEYLRCVHEGGCRMPVWWNKRFHDKTADELPGKAWLDMPVTGVSWDDAVAYCAWLGNGMRLPTEAEWEYAARGTRGTEYAWGPSWDSADVYAVVNDGLKPVQSKRPTLWGLYDLTGNAWEWCADRYDKKYYQTSPARNPSGPVDSLKYPFRVVRGGGWDEYQWNLRSANRNYGEPFRRYEGVGFRICRNLR